MLLCERPCDHEGQRLGLGTYPPTHKISGRMFSQIKKSIYSNELRHYCLLSIKPEIRNYKLKYSRSLFNSNKSSVSLWCDFKGLVITKKQHCHNITIPLEELNTL